MRKNLICPGAAQPRPTARARRESPQRRGHRYVGKGLRAIVLSGREVVLRQVAGSLSIK